MKTDPIPSRRRIGILGGMGPAATVDLMQKIIDLTPAECDQEHIPLVVWNVPQIPSRLAAIHDAGESPVDAMCEGARWLAQAGAEAIVIACNTAHHWAEDVARASGRPVLHIADSAIHALKLRPESQQRVMLLATTGTHYSGFYARRFAAMDRRLELPGSADQHIVNTAISQVKAGRLAEAKTSLLPVLDRLSREGVRLFLLSCTEIPLIVKGSSFEAQSVDATDALARDIVAFSTSATRTTRTDCNQTIPLRNGDKVA